MRAITSLTFLFLASLFEGFSQEIKLSENQVRVKKTTKWAMILPSSGQVINQKYWKAPIVLGGLGTSVYFIIDNSAEMNVFLENWGFETDNDPMTTSSLRDNNGNLYSTTDLKDGAYFYRRNRDLSILSFFGVYLLSVIDANVDAHMKFFDASEDLSMRVIPPTQKNTRGVWQVGLTLKICK